MTTIEYEGRRYIEVKRKALVGELVKIVSCNLIHGLNIGDVVTVDEYCRGGGYWLEEADGSDRDYVVLELVANAFKIGQCVKVTGIALNPPHEHDVGDVGKVVEVRKDADYARVDVDGLKQWVNVGELEIVETPKVALGDWVRSTTGRSQTGFDVPTDVEYEVIRVFLSGNVNVASDDAWATLNAGTFEVVRRKDDKTPQAPQATEAPKAQETPQTPLGAYIDANYAVMRSYYQRTPDTWRQGDVVDLTSDHPAFERGERRTLGTPWRNGDGFALVPSEGALGLRVKNGICPTSATLATPVELRTDLSADEKLRLLGNPLRLLGADA